MLDLKERAGGYCIRPNSAQEGEEMQGVYAVLRVTAHVRARALLQPSGCASGPRNAYVRSYATTNQNSLKHPSGSSVG